MKRTSWSVFIIILAAVALFAVRHRGGSDDAIEYRGEKFKLSKRYSSYEAYKNDPNNLASEDIPRIERLMLEANIGSSFDTREQFIHAVSALKFPGYGLGGERHQVEGSTLVMVSVEVPQRDKDRYLVARKSGERFSLVDDFVASSLSIAQVKLEGTTLRYYDRKGSLVREKQM